MKKQLETLIKMQKYDDLIGAKEKIRDERPLELKALKDNVALATQVYNSAKQEVDNNLKIQKAKESEIKANTEQCNKYAEQLISIKTNKEYKALNSEISTLKQKNIKIDEELIALMEEEAAKRISIKEAEEELNKVQTVLQAQEQVMNKELEGVDAEIEALRQKRNALATANLQVSLIKRYGQMIKHKNRKAVCFNENGACSGCGFTLRPQVVIEIQRQKTLINCEHCGRIIVDIPNEEIYKDL